VQRPVELGTEAFLTDADLADYGMRHILSGARADEARK
jgi:hypothetical protein